MPAMQRYAWVVLVAVVAAVRAVAADEIDVFSGIEVLDHRVFLAAVLARNPNLDAAQAALRGAEARAAQAGALMDPTVSGGIAPLSVGRSGGVDLGYELRLEQMVPYPAKRRLRAAAADSEAAMAAQDLELLRQDLSLRASRLHTAWVRVHRALAVNAEHRLLVADFQEIATARYAAGLAGQQDPLQAESELAELLHGQVSLESERQILIAEMNALLHRAPEMALPPPPAELLEETPERMPAEVPASPSAIAPAAALEAEALANRPELLALDALLRAREAAAALARLERRPDFGVMAAYNSMWSDSEHRLMFGATVDLPVRKRRLQAAITEAEALLQAARAERAAIEDEVRREVAVALVRLREAHHLLEILRSRLVPAARDRVQAAVAGFTTGQNDFSTLIDAARNLRDAELEISATLAELQGRHAELRRAVGRSPSPALAPFGEARDTEGAIR